MPVMRIRARAGRASCMRATLAVAALAITLASNASADAYVSADGGCPYAAVSQAAQSQPQPGYETPIDSGFLAFLADVDATQLELQNGRPQAFKSLWSHTGDVTLSGGFGGKIEKGWQQVGRRLDWVGTQFSNGTNTIERVAANANDDLGYVVQIEHLRFRVPGQAKDSTRTYRVTMLFRCGLEGWRIIHRQADSQMTKQAPR